MGIAAAIVSQGFSQTFPGIQSYGPVPRAPYASSQTPPTPTARVPIQVSDHSAQISSVSGGEPEDRKRVENILVRLARAAKSEEEKQFILQLPRRSGSPFGFLQYLLFLFLPMAIFKKPKAAQNNIAKTSEAEIPGETLVIESPRYIAMHQFYKSRRSEKLPADLLRLAIQYTSIYEIPKKFQKRPEKAMSFFLERLRTKNEATRLKTELIKSIRALAPHLADPSSATDLPIKSWFADRINDLALVNVILERADELARELHSVLESSVTSGEKQENVQKDLANYMRAVQDRLRVVRAARGLGDAQSLRSAGLSRIRYIGSDNFSPSLLNLRILARTLKVPLMTLLDPAQPFDPARQDTDDSPSNGEIFEALDSIAKDKSLDNAKRRRKGGWEKMDQYRGACQMLSLKGDLKISSVYKLLQGVDCSWKDVVDKIRSGGAASVQKHESSLSRNGSSAMSQRSKASRSGPKARIDQEFGENDTFLKGFERKGRRWVDRKAEDLNTSRGIAFAKYGLPDSQNAAPGGSKKSDPIAESSLFAGLPLLNSALGKDHNVSELLNQIGRKVVGNISYEAYQGYIERVPDQELASEFFRLVREDTESPLWNLIPRPQGDYSFADWLDSSYFSEAVEHVEEELRYVKQFGTYKDRLTFITIHFLVEVMKRWSNRDAQPSNVGSIGSPSQKRRIFHILTVDDFPYESKRNRRSIEALRKSYDVRLGDFRFTEAQNADEALKEMERAIAAEKPFDLTTTDLSMEGRSDGANLVKEVRRREARFHRPRKPIIMVASGHPEKLIQTGLLDAAVDKNTEAINPELTETVATILNLSRRIVLPPAQSLKPGAPSKGELEERPGERLALDSTPVHKQISSGVRISPSALESLAAFMNPSGDETLAYYPNSGGHIVVRETNATHFVYVDQADYPGGLTGVVDRMSKKVHALGGTDFTVRPEGSVAFVTFDYRHPLDLKLKRREIVLYAENGYDAHTFRPKELANGFDHLVTCGASTGVGSGFNTPEVQLWQLPAMRVGGTFIGEEDIVYGIDPQWIGFIKIQTEEVDRWRHFYRKEREIDPQLMSDLLRLDWLIQEERGFRHNFMRPGTVDSRQFYQALLLEMNAIIERLPENLRAPAVERLRTIFKPLEVTLHSSRAMDEANRIIRAVEVDVFRLVFGIQGINVDRIAKTVQIRSDFLDAFYHTEMEAAQKRLPKELSWSKVENVYLSNLKDALSTTAWPLEIARAWRHRGTDSSGGLPLPAQNHNTSAAA